MWVDEGEEEEVRQLDTETTLERPVKPLCDVLCSIIRHALRQIRREGLHRVERQDGCVAHQASHIVPDVATATLIKVILASGLLALILLLEVVDPVARAEAVLAAATAPTLLSVTLAI